MKIAHIISSPASGGAEIFAKDLVIEINNNSENECIVIFLESAEEVGRDIAFQDKYLFELKLNNIDYFFLGNSCRKNPIRGTLRLKKILDNNNIDLVHSHLYYGLIFSYFLFSYKVVYTHHSIALNVKWPSLFYKIMNLRVSAYVGICNACVEIISKVSGRKVVGIHNGVSLKRILKKENYKSENKISIIMLGRLDSPKNYEMMIDVVALLKDYDFSVNIAGEGPLKNALKNYANDKGVAERVFFLGNVSNVSLSLARYDLFAMTSAWEGLPIALIEASLTGLPVIVTNVGGCAEVVHSVLNGIVVDEISPENYSEKLKLLLDNPDLLKQFSDNALRFSSTYELGEVTEKHLQLYYDVKK